MTTKRLAILVVVLLGGLSSIFLLPKQLGFQPLGVRMQLPNLVGSWFDMRDLEVTKKEREVLGTETEFARKAYRDQDNMEIIVSIVLSGQDMNTSIHRPERCLPAQGFTIIDKRAVPIAIPDHTALKVTRLQNVRNVQGGENGAAMYNLTYYWFAGHTDMTGSHFTRTLYDVRDRLLHGYNQRWAYLTVAAALPERVANDPKLTQMVDARIQDFIRQLVPKIEIKEGSEPAAKVAQN